jgi:hypothetical protein
LKVGEVGSGGWDHRGEVIEADGHVAQQRAARQACSQGRSVTVDDRRAGSQARLPPGDGTAAPFLVVLGDEPASVGVHEVDVEITDRPKGPPPHRLQGLLEHLLRDRSDDHCCASRTMAATS